MTQITALSYVDDLMPYQPGLPIEVVVREYGIAPEDIIKLASNENPLGMSPKAHEALKATADMSRYPEQHSLIQALADHYQVAPNSVVVGNGSNDVLDMAARAFLGEGLSAVSAQYGFAIYRIATQSAGAKNIVVPADDFGHDLTAMLAAIDQTTRVVWIANPNNPTGTFLSYSAIKEFLGSVPDNVIIVLDEAYFEYLAPENTAQTTSWIQEYPNLLVVRTFSKIYGLAGLRIGYGIGSPELIGFLNRVRQPFNVGSGAIAAASAALEDDEFIARSLEANNAGRTQLVSGLKNLGLDCLPAYGNFVTCRIDGAEAITEELLEQGIIIRPLASYSLANYVRITIGQAHENKRLLFALGEILRSR